MLGDNIRRIRKERCKLSINNLSKIAGVSLGYLSDLENNKLNPTMDKLNKIAEALGVSVDEFFKDEQTNTRLITPTKPENLFAGPGKLIKNAKDFDVPQDYSDKYIVTSRDKKQYEEEMKKANEAFFLNDELSEEAKKEMLDLMSELFWQAKAMNKRKPKDK